MRFRFNAWNAVEVIIVIVIIMMTAYSFLNKIPAPTAGTTSALPQATTTIIAASIPPNTTIGISATDYGFSPNHFNIVSGERVTLTVWNRGRQPHDLYIQALNVNTTLINGGQNKTVTFTFPKVLANITFYSTPSADLNSGKFNGTFQLVPSSYCGGVPNC